MATYDEDLNCFTSIPLAGKMTGTVEIDQTGKCDCCSREDLPCLMVDSSGGKYGEVCICLACIGLLFANEKPIKD